jgi:hypothetical protein
VFFFLLNTSFEKAINNTDLVQKQEDFYLCGAAKSVVHHDRPRMLNGLKGTITAGIRNISQADLQKLFANKIKRVQACVDTRGHHF